MTTTVRPSRRSVVRGAAWSVPVVSAAVSAPAFAASPCETTYSYRLDWGTTPYTKTGEDGQAVVAPPVAGPASLTVNFISTVSNATTVKRPATNLSVPTTLNPGGIGANERALRIEHASAITAGRANRQMIAISFTRPVTGLTFTITDVDSSNSAANGQTRNGWWDQVELSGVRNATLASGLTGSGTQAAPWKMVSNNTNAGTNDPAGNVTVTYPGEVSSITLTYWSDTAGGNQAIALSDFVFSAKGC